MSPWVSSALERSPHMRVIFTVLLLCGVRAVSAAENSSAAVQYLKSVSDQFQQTVDVYTDADAAGNHFAARGEFHDPSHSSLLPIMDEISGTVECYRGITCITATFDPKKNDWGGWYFLNGVLGPHDSAPTSNWGTIPNAGYNLTGATQLTFLARGAVGGERVHFFAFGVGNTAVQMPYSDSALRTPGIYAAPWSLTTSWTPITISLQGLDIHYVLGGFGWSVVAAEQTNAGVPVTFYLDDIQYIDPRPNDPRLLLSYETVKSTNMFDTVMRNTAFVYDNSVALIALLGSGDVDHARTIADALIFGQEHDRFFDDGRIRNAYQAGDIQLPNGWIPNNRAGTVRMSGRYDSGHKQWFEDATQVSSNTGNVAWAMLALLGFYEATGETKYLDAVERMGDWVLANTADQRGSGGFTGGYDGWENAAASGSSYPCASGEYVNGQCKRLYKATEHNVDLYSAFSRLYLADGQEKWHQAARNARTFVLSLWDASEGKFWTGTTENGVTIATDIIPLDIQAWALESLGYESLNYETSLQYADTHHKTTFGYGFKQNGGNACGDYTWFEGTAQVALAYYLEGNEAKWQEIVDGIHEGQKASGGVPATDGDCLNTGFTLNDGSPWLYFPRTHVGATSWLALAEMKLNPFKGLLYSRAADLTARATITSSAITYNRTTHLYSQQVSITNNGGDLPAAALVLDPQSSGWTVANADGVTTETDPAGRSYKELGHLSTGATVSVIVRFSRTGNQPIQYGARIFGPGKR